MKITKPTLAALAGLAAAALAGAIGCGAPHEPKAVEPTSVAAATAPVESVAIPKRVELYGTVETERSAAVSSRVMGNVVSVRVRPGDAVRAGDVLVEIDPQTAKGQESQARGALAQASAALALAERNHQRFQALVASGAASQLELDMARMQYEQAKGAVEQGKGAVEAASSVAKESRVVAPFAGRVAARLVEAGDFAAPGRPLVMIESSGGRRLVVSVPESLAGSPALAIGAPLSASVDSLPGRTLGGRVAEMTPGADPMSHTFTLKVELTGSPVPSGVSGRAWLEDGSRKAVLVPRTAVLAQGGLTLVVVKDAEGKARSRAVTLGGPVPGASPAQGDRVEVLAGLTGGETVLIGLTSVPADGAAVTATASPEVKR